MLSTCGKAVNKEREKERETERERQRERERERKAVYDSGGRKVFDIYVLTNVCANIV